MYRGTPTNYHCIRLRIGKNLITRLSLFAAVALCMAAPGAMAQSAGPFPGSAVDTKTMRTQERVEELFDEGDYSRALIIYRDELAPIGDKYAQYMVGYIYLTGAGVEEDAVLASAWYRLAAERAYKEFQNERDQILANFTPEQLLRSDNLYLQLRRKYSDVVLILALVDADLDMLKARTGSRLSGGGGSVTIVNVSSGSSVSGDQFFGQVRKRIKSRLTFMSKQLDMLTLNTNPDNVDLNELAVIVDDFVARITDRDLFVSDLN